MKRGRQLRLQVSAIAVSYPRRHWRRMILWGPPRGPDVDPALQQPGSRVLALRRKVNAVDHRGYQASVMAAVVQSVVRCFGSIPVLAVVQQPTRTKPSGQPPNSHWSAVGATFGAPVPGVPMRTANNWIAGRAYDLPRAVHEPNHNPVVPAEAIHPTRRIAQLHGRAVNGMSMTLQRLRASSAVIEVPTAAVAQQIGGSNAASRARRQ